MKKSIKKAISLLLTVAIAVSLSAFFIETPVNAETTEYNEGFFTYKINGTNAVITQISETASGDIIVPASLGGYPVKQVGDGSWNNAKVLSEESNITSISFADGIEKIGKNAFYNCDSLANVTFSNTINSIGYEAFMDCDGIREIIVYQDTFLGYSSFSSCDSLKKITIGSNSEISSFAFCNCSLLSDINLSPNTIISEEAFSYCNSLIRIDIPDNCKVKYAFGSCQALNQINISPNAIIEDNFYNTAYYNNESNWENGILYLSDILISSQTELPETITVKPGTKKILSGAFYSNPNIKEVVLPNGLKEIGYSFTYCENLEKINIPESVVSIKGNYMGPPFIYRTKIYQPSSTTRELYIDDCLIKKYDLSESFTIPSGTRLIAGYAVIGEETLTELIIPDSVKYISEAAFYACDNLKSVTIPKTVLNIEDYAFGYSYNRLSRGGDGGGPIFIPIPDFKIYCYAGTAGMDYAIENGFDYEIIGGADEVEISKTSVKLNYKEISNISAKAVFDDYETPEKIIYKSSNPEVATVDENGNITAVGSGTTTITATIEGTDISDSCEITVSYAWWQWLIRIFLLGFLWY